ncbi:hypothetical protein KUTeg_000334 [Tegillarca granosa]|uniref:DNA mismatch repair protein MutS core domain-containing protein n=1 Tax=Tegillarca granosa TaxID=220873 RepID=A0ABQ9FX83_TEGGR|nr:hypothetical protein KUTeg_000334 [Tegillarca granosa]
MEAADSLGLTAKDEYSLAISALGAVIWSSYLEQLSGKYSPTISAIAAVNWSSYLEQLSYKYSLIIGALGAVIWYLQYSLLDQELLSMNHFEEYQPIDADTETTKSKSKSSVFFGRQHTNLVITENSSTGTLEGTLLERLDQCCTPFGHRLFRQWLCAPLCNPDSINDRLDAVYDLIGSQDIVFEVIDLMKKLPDLERFLGRIHSLGSASRGKNHPDSRAIFFDEAKYSKKKIEDFLSTLEGFRTTLKIGKKFSGCVSGYKSKLLKKTMTLDSVEDSGGLFPDLKEDLQFFENAFDHNKAKKDGVIVPSSGVDPEYDQAISDIKSTERKLNDYLEKQKTRLGCRVGKISEVRHK